MAEHSETETQVESAKRMYNSRAANYEDGWHPDYSQRFMKLVPLRKGDRVLDLCCGTGLEAFPAAEIVGDDGEVIGVDVTQGMLDELHKRQQSEPMLGARIKTFLHDVTNLQTLSEVKEKEFDVILCSNAFVLFDEPSKVVRHWCEYLKPGGVMVIDITHENNMRSGLLLERAAARLNLKFPANRSWIKSEDSFREILEQEGFTVENTVLLDKITGERYTYYSVDDADEQFDYITSTPLTIHLMTDEFKEKGRSVFKEEFTKDAVDGKVALVDALYVYVARKTA